MNRRLGLALVLTGLVVTLWVAPLVTLRATYGARVTADEPQYLLTAISLGEDRSLDIGDERAEARYRDFHELALPNQEEPRADGSRLSPHDPLLPLVLAAPVRVGGWAAAKLTLAVLAGVLGAVLVWTAVRRFAVPIGVAVLTVLCFSLAAPLAVYGTQIYPELPAALAVAVAIAALTGPLRGRGLIVLGAAVVALPWLSVKYLPVTAALVLVAAIRLWRRDDRRPLLLFLGGLGAAGLLYAGLHQAWYGGWTVYARGDHFVEGGEFTVSGSNPDYAGRATRLTGLLTDRGFGLAAWQPAFLLAVPALVALLRRRPTGWAALGAPLAAGWLTATFVALTMHGWWWPGRQVVVVVPALVLAVAWWAARYRPARVLVAVGLGLGAATVAWLAADTWTDHMRLVIDFESTTNPFYRLWRLALPDGRLQPAGTDLLRALWFAVLGVFAGWGWRSVRTDPRKETQCNAHPPARLRPTAPDEAWLQPAAPSESSPRPPAHSPSSSPVAATTTAPASVR